MHFYTIKPLYLRNSNLDFREGFRAIVAIVKTLVIQPCFQKTHNLPMTLKFEQSPFFGIHVAHIQQCSIHSHLFCQRNLVAEKTSPLLNLQNPANLFTLKMSTNLRCRVPNSTAVSTQLYTTWWDCKYQCFRGRRKCRNFRQFSVLFAYGPLYPHGPLQLSRVTLLVSNTDTVQRRGWKKHDPVKQPNPVTAPDQDLHRPAKTQRASRTVSTTCRGN